MLPAGDEPASAPGCRRARPEALWTPREGPHYPHQSLPLAVSSMTHGGCFPRLCPALLQTVHSVLDGVCSSPAFLSVSGTHGWYEAVCSGSISLPAPCSWAIARISSGELVANGPRWKGPSGGSVGQHTAGRERGQGNHTGHGAWHPNP